MVVIFISIDPAELQQLRDFESEAVCPVSFAGEGTNVLF
jgi:hypothetical protein